MPITLGSNIASLLAQRELGRATNSVAKISERLASGLRINHASDDAAGLALASTLNSEVRLAEQARRNVNDGISLLNVAEAAVGQLSEITDRLRELATQSANGILGVKQRAALQSEADALTQEYNRIVATTKYNDTSLLSGAGGAVTIQAGAGSRNTLSIDVANALSGASSGSGSLSVSSTPGSTAYTILDFASTSWITYGSYSVGAASTLSTDYITFKAMDSEGVWSDYYVWVDAAGYGVDPGLSGICAVATVIDPLDVAEVASAYAAAINSLGGGFSAFPGGDNVIINYTYGANSLGGSPSFFQSWEDRVQSITSGSSFLLPWVGPFFWYNVDGGGGGPGFEIDINSWDDSAQIAWATAMAINATGLAVASFNSDTQIRIDNVGTGLVGSSVYLEGGIIEVASGPGSNPVSNPNPATEIFTYSGHSLQTGQEVTVASTGSLPGGLSALTTYYVIKQTDNTFKLASSAANAASGTAINLSSAGTGTISVGWTSTPGAQVATSYISALDISSAAAARTALDTAATLADRLSQTRAAIGANQSRLEVMLNVLTARRENVAAAAARITDADVAYEAAAYVREQIRQNVAAAILGQANQLPSLALQLLGDLN